MAQKEENEKLRNICDAIIQERDRAIEELAQYKDSTQAIIDQCIQYDNEFRAVIDDIKKQKNHYEELNNELVLLIKKMKLQTVGR